MRLQTQFSLAASALVTVVVAASTALTLASERRLLNNEIRARQKQLAASLASVAAESQYQSELSLLNYFRTLKNERGFERACFVVNNRVVQLDSDPAKSGSAFTGPTAPVAPRAVVALRYAGPGGRPLIDFVAPVVDAGRTVGTTHLIYSGDAIRSYLNASTWETSRRLGVVSLLSLLFGWIVAAMLARSLMPPIRRLLHGMDEVARGRLDPLDWPARGDEFGWMQDRLNETIDKLRELDRMKQEFVAGVTHDLKAPLIATDRFLYMMLKGLYGPLSTEQRDLLVTMQNNTTRLMQLIEDLLTAARIEAGRVTLEPRPFDLNDLAREIGRLYEPLAREKGLVFRLDLPPAAPIVADRERCMQIFTNLVSNALKFTSAGEIRFAVRPRDSDVEIEVADTGSGIPAGERERVFEKFYRTVSAKNTKGTGLGLAIVLGFVTAHGGRISVGDNAPRGTTFTVTLPLSPPAAEAAFPS